MKRITIGLIIAAFLGLIIVFYVFRQETVSAGRYQVTYHKSWCKIDPKSFPQDLGSLQQIPGLVRITWQEQIGSEMFQEYCYLPGKGMEKGRLIHKK